MRMPGEDAQKILNRGKFLEERGFKATPDAYGVDYFDGNIRIMAYYECYENNSGLDIKFPGNYHFQISWIGITYAQARAQRLKLEEERRTKRC